MYNLIGFNIGIYHEASPQLRQQTRPSLQVSPWPLRSPLPQSTCSKHSLLSVPADCGNRIFLKIRVQKFALK